MSSDNGTVGSEELTSPSGEVDIRDFADPAAPAPAEAEELAAISEHPESEAEPEPVAP